MAHCDKCSGERRDFQTALVAWACAVAGVERTWICTCDVELATHTARELRLARLVASDLGATTDPTVELRVWSVLRSHGFAVPEYRDTATADERQRALEQKRALDSTLGALGVSLTIEA